MAVIVMRIHIKLIVCCFMFFNFEFVVLKSMEVILFYKIEANMGCNVTTVRFTLTLLCVNVIFIQLFSKCIKSIKHKKITVSI